MLSFKTVLCAIDFDAGSDRALVRAADMAERTRSSLHLLHVDPTFRARLAQVPGGDIDATYRARMRAYVNDRLDADDAYDVLAPEAHVIHGGAAADGILRTAKASGADLIVVGTHSRVGLGHLLLGSVAADVLKRSECPVLVVPERAAPEGPGPDRPILVPVDFSPHTPLALRAAEVLANAYSAPVELMHVLEGTTDTLVDFGGMFVALDLNADTRDDSRSLALAGLERLSEGMERVRECHVVTGVAESEIVTMAESREAGAIVMGTHGRRGLDRLFLGSVAEWTARHAPCAVLALPAQMLVPAPEGFTDGFDAA